VGCETELAGNQGDKEQGIGQKYPHQHGEQTSRQIKVKEGRRKDEVSYNPRHQDQIEDLAQHRIRNAQNPRPWGVDNARAGALAHPTKGGDPGSFRVKPSIRDGREVGGDQEADGCEQEDDKRAHGN